MEKQEYIDKISALWDRLDGQELKKLKRLIRIFCVLCSASDAERE